MPTPFLRDKPCNFAPVIYMMPIPRSDLRGGGAVPFLFFFAEDFWAKVVHIFRKILTDEKSGKRKKQKTSDGVFAKAHRRRAQNSTF